MLVTDRLTPLRVDGRIIHQVWLPYHFGFEGLVTGDSANDLFGITLDPNVLIQESKVGTCDVRPGRRPDGSALLDLVVDYRRRAGILRASATRRWSRPTSPTAAATRRPDRCPTPTALYGPLDPAPDAGYEDAPPRMGFFTDTSVCIGCKACEVACKEWNGVPGLRPGPAGHVVRQHRGADRELVATRRVHRAAPPVGAWECAVRGYPDRPDGQRGVGDRRGRHYRPDRHSAGPAARFTAGRCPHVRRRPGRCRRVRGDHAAHGGATGGPVDVLGAPFAAGPAGGSAAGASNAAGRGTADARPPPAGLPVRSFWGCRVRSRRVGARVWRGVRISAG